MKRTTAYVVLRHRKKTKSQKSSKVKPLEKRLIVLAGGRCLEEIDRQVPKEKRKNKKSKAFNADKVGEEEEAKQEIVHLEMFTHVSLNGSYKK